MTTTPHVGISDDFLEAFAKIPKAKQKRVREFMEKFRANPRAPSIHLEPIHDMRDDKVRTVRIGDDYRAIIVHPPEGDLFLCVWVDHHDEAMRWARNKRFEINPVVGSLQVYEVKEGAPAAAISKATLDDDEERVPGGRLLVGKSHSDLLRCGVPAALVPAVRALRTEADLDDLAPYLPSEASDALFMLAAGGSVDEAISEAAKQAPKKVDVSDYVAALNHPASQWKFKIIDSERELLEVMDAPLERWRIFLHPSQRALVTMKANGPVRVLGGPGTGKTVVAMHRAKHLAGEVFTNKDDRILVTTFTKNLARDIREQLRKLCGTDAAGREAFGRIDVKHLHAWAPEYLRSQGVRFSMLALGDRTETRRLWDTAFADGPALPFPASFYWEEWGRVVQPNDVREVDAYLKVKRVGRGTPLSRGQRLEVWKVLSRYRDALDRAGKLELADVLRECRLYLERQGSRPYRAVIADEVQDLGSVELRLLRAIVAPGPNDVFVVGDAHQRIYATRTSLSACGLETRGRSKRLRINYRTTRQISGFATALLAGVPVDDLDEESDELRGYRSLRDGPRPEVVIAKNVRDEETAILETIARWRTAGRDEEICLTARTHALLTDRYATILKTAKIPFVELETESDADAGPGVRLATMHRIKGLEFPRVLIAGIHDGTMPLALGPEELPDETAKAEHEERDRLLLFVAATRARDELLVTGFGTPSPLFGA